MTKPKPFNPFYTHYSKFYVEDATGKTIKVNFGRLKQKSSNSLTFSVAKRSIADTNGEIGEVIYKWRVAYAYLFLVGETNIEVRKVSFFKNTYYKAKDAEFMPLMKLSMNETAVLEGWTLYFSKHQEENFSIPWGNSDIPVEWEKLDREMAEKGLPEEVRDEVAHLARSASENHRRKAPIPEEVEAPKLHENYPAL